MWVFAERYGSFVMEEYEAAKQTCLDTEILFEQKVDYSRWVKADLGLLTASSYLTVLRKSSTTSTAWAFW